MDIRRNMLGHASHAIGVAEVEIATGPMITYAIDRVVDDLDLDLDLDTPTPDATDEEWEAIGAVDRPETDDRGPTLYHAHDDALRARLASHPQ